MFLPRRSCPLLSWTPAAALSSHLTQVGIYLLVCTLISVFLFYLFLDQDANKKIMTYNFLRCVLLLVLYMLILTAPFFLTAFHSLVLNNILFARNPFPLLWQIWSFFSRNAFPAILAARTCWVPDCHHPWPCERSSILRHRPGYHPNPQIHPPPQSHSHPLSSFSSTSWPEFLNLRSSSRNIFSSAVSSIRLIPGKL